MEVPTARLPVRSIRDNKPMNEKENERLPSAPLPPQSEMSGGGIAPPPPPQPRAKRGSVWRAIGAAAGWLALYFGIRYVISFALVAAYALIWALGANTTDILEWLTEEKLGKVTFLEIILSTIAVFAASLIVYLIRDRKYLRSERVGYRRGSGFGGVRAATVPILIALGFTLNLAVSLAFDILPIPEELISDYIEQSSTLSETSLMSIIATAVCAPLSEELIFRGLLVSSLGSALPTWAVLLITSAIFGLIHGQVLRICYAFLLGLYLGFVRLRTGSNTASFLLHAAFNASSFILPLLPLPEDSSRALLGIIAAAALGVSAALTWLFLHLTKRGRKDINQQDPTTEVIH